MAESSEHDKRVLLGADYIEKERLEAAEKARRGGKEDPEVVRARWQTWLAEDDRREPSALKAYS